MTVIFLDTRFFVSRRETDDDGREEDCGSLFLVVLEEVVFRVTGPEATELLVLVTEVCVRETFLGDRTSVEVFDCRVTDGIVPTSVQPKGQK